MVNSTGSFTRLRTVRVMIVCAALLASMAITTSSATAQTPPSSSAQISNAGVKGNHGSSGRGVWSSRRGHFSSQGNGWAWGWHHGHSHGGHSHGGHSHGEGNGNGHGSGYGWCNPDPDPDPDPPKPVPTADFTYNPLAPVATKVVEFDASTSTGGQTPGLTGVITKYDWDFGDGTAVESTTTPVVSHAFAAAGDFPVSLTVTNDQAETDTIIREVHVVPAPPPWDPGDPQLPEVGGTAPPADLPEEPATVIPAAPRAGTLRKRGGKRLLFTTSISFAAPAGVSAEDACVGDVSLRGSARRAGKTKAVAPLVASGSRCKATFRLTLPQALTGKPVKLDFSFAGNDNVAAWRVVKTLTIKP
ncbi:MAG: PKD domain-containing protein [Solirubrobacterales bacterium]